MGLRRPLLAKIEQVDSEVAESMADRPVLTFKRRGER
jgi:hypothetical protein